METLLKDLPQGTPEEKEYRKDMLSRAKKVGLNENATVEEVEEAESTGEGEK